MIEIFVNKLQGFPALRKAVTTHVNKHDIFHVCLSLGARQCKLKNNSVLLDFQKTLDIKTVDLLKFVAVTSCKSITHIEVQTKVYDI